MHAHISNLCQIVFWRYFRYSFVKSLEFFTQNSLLISFPITSFLKIYFFK